MTCLVILILLLAWAFWEARTSFPIRAQIFPAVVSGSALLLTVLELGRVTLVEFRRTEEGPARARLWVTQVVAGAPYLLWIGGYLLAILVLGFPIASFTFVLLFLRLVAQMRWTGALASSAILIAVILLFGNILNVNWPEGLMVDLLPFP